jgi:SAM-dependent methyltransferase
MLDLDAQSARKLVEPRGFTADLRGRDVLCLAGGGGQQSAAFALLGANVTVFDLSETQLSRDREAAAHYRVSVRTVQGDMRDLSCFADDSFDVVWHGHSLGFIPDPRRVFAEAARVLRAGGLYYLACHNPFYHGLCETDWNGQGYVLRRLYVDGEEVVYDDPEWTVWRADGTTVRVRGPREFRHGLGTIIGGMIEQGFVILDGREQMTGRADAPGGSWDHCQSVAPPYLEFWTRLGEKRKGVS